MTRDIYSIDADSVDSVFFAVVPDSFMRRSGPVSGRRYTVADGEFADAQVATMVTPHDRWSF